ncbi:MAG: hypothetical protein ACR2J3_13480 [Aridibacter sp.]
MDKKASRENRPKKVRIKKTKNTKKPQSLNKQKKEILENIVAAIYKTPGITIDEKVNLTRYKLGVLSILKNLCRSSGY